MLGGGGGIGVPELRRADDQSEARLPMRHSFRIGRVLLEQLHSVSRICGATRHYFGDDRNLPKNCSRNDESGNSVYPCIGSIGAALSSSDDQAD